MLLKNKNRVLKCISRKSEVNERREYALSQKPIFYLIPTLFLLEKNSSTLRLFSFVFLVSAFRSVEIYGTLWFSINVC